MIDPRQEVAEHDLEKAEISVKSQGGGADDRQSAGFC